MILQDEESGRGWLKRNRWYIITGLIVLYLVLKLLIFK
jgi:uncharacterized membrane protein